MAFLTVLLAAGSTSYMIACGYSSETLYACTGLGWLMVVAQYIEENNT